MDVEVFVRLSPEALRERLPAMVAERVDDASLRDTISSELADLVASWSDSEVASSPGCRHVGGIGRRVTRKAAGSR